MTEDHRYYAVSADRSLLVVEQNAVGRAFEVVVLAGAQRPQEHGQPAAAKDQARANQIEDDIHVRRPRSRKLFAITSSDELDIASAASQGVTYPATASGTISTL